MPVMIVTQLKFSFFIQFREMNLIEPVKFRARYVVTAGIIRRGVIDPATDTYPERSGGGSNLTTNELLSKTQVEVLLWRNSWSELMAAGSERLPFQQEQRR